MKLQTFKKDLFFEYIPSPKTFELGLLVMEKLGKLNVRMKELFKDYKKPSRIFAFIESKFTSKIEGIYTTLFDVVNTGIETNQQKIIRPIVDELFKSKSGLTTSRLIHLAEVMNSIMQKDQRYSKEFGIYKTVNNKKIKIYEPPKNKQEVENLFEEVVNKANNDSNIIQMIHTHILFEKVHPFVDANGRLGRLLLQKSLIRLMNFSNVLPLSWAFFSDTNSYYSSFDINNFEDLDSGIRYILNIFLKMYNKTKEFLKNVTIWIEKNIDFVKNTSFKLNEDIALDILLSLQTKRVYLERNYKLNPRTIDSIFQKINNEIPFNVKKANRNILYWNIELEELVSNHFKD